MNNNRRNRINEIIAIGIVLTGLFALGSPLAWAQEVDEKEQALPTPKYILPEIVVTATRINQSVNEVPLSTDVISSREVESSNALHAGDILRTSTGINVRSYNMAGVATASLRGSQSAQVLVIQDGMPIFDPFTGLTDLSQISLAGVERIEIVRGPTSHLYGANALGGVINIITRRPRDRSSANISVGSFDTRKYHLQTEGVAGKAGYLLSGTVDRSDGWRGNDDFLNRNIFAKLTGESERVNVQLSTGYFTSDMGLPGPRPASSTKYGNNDVTTLFDRQQNLKLYALLALEFGLGSDANLTLKVRPASSTTNFRTTYDDLPTGETIVNDNEYVAHSVTLTGQLETPLGRQRLLMGFDGIGRRAAAVQKYTYQASDSVYVDQWDPESRTAAVWLEYIWRWSNLGVVPGIRLDRHSEYGTSTSPNIGMTLDWGANTFRASVGQAFRAPAFNDLFWPLAGNRDLKSETGVAYEFGLERRFSQSLTVDLVLFRRAVHNMIAWAPTGPGGLWRPTNINRYSVNGLETEFEVRLPGFQVSVSYSLMDAQQTNQEVVYDDWLTAETRLEDITRSAAFVPRHSASAQLDFPLAGFDVNLRGEYRGSVSNYYADYSQSPTVTRAEKILPARTDLDLRLSRSLAKVTPYMEVRNILDTRYSEHFGTTFTDGDFPLPGRTITVGIRLNL